MGSFDVRLIDDGVLHRRFDLRVSEYLLDLFDRHAFIDSARRHCPPEFVRVNPWNPEASTQFFQPDFDAADLQSVVRSVQGNE